MDFRNLCQCQQGEIDYRQMTAPCGLDCFNCPIYHANHNDELRKEIAQQMNVPEKEAVCSGCRNQQGIIRVVGMTSQCKAYRCSKEKNVDFCCECSNFPCDFLHPYVDKITFPNNTKVFNLCLIKKMGLEKWAKEKAQQVKAEYYHGELKLSD